MRAAMSVAMRNIHVVAWCTPVPSCATEIRFDGPQRREAIPKVKGMRLLLAHMHDARHVRVHSADVAEIAFVGERVLEFVVGVQAL